MARGGPPELGTLIISALMLLTLGFAGNWIIDYSRTGGAPWSSVYWFAGVGAVIVFVGLVVGLTRGRSG
ncbi:MAG: hypothetical protein ACRERC_01620 [Candidatus Binatia bacterium]